MSASNRAAKITKIQKVVKKHYKPVSPVDRPLLEHLLYACCLENANHDAADEAFAKLQELYFDWNEVRVTTISELAEVMSKLPDSKEAARRLKLTLQAIFESHYTFDVEFLKKQNLGKAIKEIEQHDCISRYSIAYITQHGLGGHAIPINQSVLEVMVILDVISENEAKKGKVPGLERAIPKTKGAEFGSLLHQLGVDFAGAKHSPRIRNLLLEIDPSAKERLPKRGAKKVEEKAAPKKKATKKAAAKEPAKKTPAKKVESKGKPAAKSKAPVKKKATTKKAKKATTKKSKPSSTKSLTKRKPR